VERRPVADWKIDEWVLGPQRQRDRRAVTAAQLFEAGGTFYVEEAKTGRWLVGRRPRSDAKLVECDQQFSSLAALAEASAYPPLPNAPDGWAIREVARLPQHPTRLAGDGNGRTVYALGVNGGVWRVEVATGAVKQVLRAEDYIDLSLGEPVTVGMVLDGRRRLYIVVNQRVESARPVRNDVTIFRTTAERDGDPAEPKPWLRTSYPWGIGPFNHGVGHIAFGPDGSLYVTSGSRTDGNEPGNDDRYSKAGETPLTACIWRLDPSATDPQIEVYARGLRNAYGFCWNPKGEMFATDNGPDADPPEELNRIERGGHYGFPYQFSDWPRKPYPYTPDSPPGVRFTPPIRNVGPAAGGSPDKPLSTFDPHSSPSGIVCLGEGFPSDLRGRFLVARFGNLLDRPTDVGFDVLLVRLRTNDSSVYEAETRTLLSPVARPVDLHLGAPGQVFICEYSRQVRNAGYAGLLPGRILELKYIGR
jgi:glucose/arabinose dehydrogenase